MTNPADWWTAVESVEWSAWATVLAWIAIGISLGSVVITVLMSREVSRAHRLLEQARAELKYRGLPREKTD
jgi:hypothetical protein